MYNWNPIFNLIIKIKNNYQNTFKDFNTYDFETWLHKLNKDEYNSIFESLQINQQNNILLIRYGLAEMQKGLWANKNSIYRECRSIVIDIVDEKIIIAPFKKFFNLNEVFENQLKNVEDEISIAKNIEITNKLDGSMQCARWYKGEVFMSGSMSINREDSWRLDDGYKKLTVNHMKMLKENPNYTFIFEYISLKDSHVVLYKKSQEGLYLIGIRDVNTGRELTYKEIKEVSIKYEVPMTELENKTLNEIIKESKTLKSSEKEGWVLLIEHYDGTVHRIKFKCDDYIKLHRLLDKISSVNVIIQNIAEEKYDDMISKVPDGYKYRVEQIAKKIYEYRHNTEQEVEKLYNKAPKDDRKTFMKWVDTNVPKQLNRYVKCKYFGESFNVLLKGKGTIRSYKKLKDMGVYDNYSALFADLDE